MLILFDIDATLITTSRSGVLALENAGKARFGEGFTIEGVDFAGRLDPLIIADLLRRNGQAVTVENATAMREGYQRELGPLLAKPGVAKTCPGVLELLEVLRVDQRLTLGLLTGNFADTGEAKLVASGVPMEPFTVRVWGDESPHSPPSREHLPPIGMERFAKLRGRAIGGEQVVIVGDTPHDARCAKVNGCRCLGVGTGQFRPSQLMEAGADHAVVDLSETRVVADWLVESVSVRL
ncbi:MAG: HAD hydrolase-like protein [Planctomycetota bacterium]